MSNLLPNQFEIQPGIVITERGLICQKEVTQSTLEDRKTETRRTTGLEKYSEDHEPHVFIRDEFREDQWEFFSVSSFSRGQIENPNIKSPYGKPGDLLYIRENFKLAAWRKDGRMAFDYMASPELTQTPWCRFTEEEDPESEKFNAIIEKASDILQAKGIQTDADGHYHWEPGKSPLPWKPSIHMPKIASRIWLMVEEISVEQLQDITEESAKAEGAKYLYYKSGKCIQEGFKDFESYYSKKSSYKQGFHWLWESIHGPESWESNPWVWVVKFRVLSKIGRPSNEVIWENFRKVTHLSSSAPLRESEKGVSHA